MATWRWSLHIPYSPASIFKEREVSLGAAGLATRHPRPLSWVAGHPHLPSGKRLLPPSIAAASLRWAGGRAWPLCSRTNMWPGRANWRVLSLRARRGSRAAQMIRSHQWDYREGALDRDFYAWGVLVGRMEVWKCGRILQEIEGQTALQSHKVEKGRKASGLDLKSWGFIWSECSWTKLATGVFNCVWQ